MTLKDYVSLKDNIGLGMRIVLDPEYTKDYRLNQIEVLLSCFKKCGGSEEQLKHYLDVLYMYDDESVKQMLIQPTLLMIIDTEPKEVAWILRMNNYKI